MARIMDSTKKELRPLLLVLLFLGLGIFLVWAADYWINGDEVTTVGDAVLVSLLVMPILIYTIISGSLAELRGPGGLGATFNSVATTSVSGTIALDRVSVEEGSKILTEEGTDALKRKIRSLEETRPIVMTLTLGGSYTLEALQEYVKALSRSRNFKLVVFLDRDGRFVAYMPSWAAMNRLHTPGKGEEFVEVINKGLPELFYYPGVVRKTISASCTNAEALRVMTEKNIEALVVTDENNRLQGIVERDQVLSRMVLALSQ
jgi:CBS domain-containing protein